MVDRSVVTYRLYRLLMSHTNVKLPCEYANMRIFNMGTVGPDSFRVRPFARPSDRPSDRPSVRPSDRPSVRPTVRPSDRPPQCATGVHGRSI